MKEHKTLSFTYHAYVFCKNQIIIKGVTAIFKTGRSLKFTKFLAPPTFQIGYQI